MSLSPNKGDTKEEMSMKSDGQNEDSNSATSLKSEATEAVEEAPTESNKESEDKDNAVIGTDYANEDSKAGPEKNKFSLMDYHPYSPR